MNRAILLCTASFALAACSSNSSAPNGGTSGGGTSTSGGGNSVSGSITGKQWTNVKNAYWMGKPSAGSAPVLIFLFETSMACADITVANWDKLVTSQLLEIGVIDTAIRAYQVPSEADAAYLFNNYNPSADGGTVTISSITPNVRITGSYDVTYGTDSLKGTFDAEYCADGVEP